MIMVRMLLDVGIISREQEDNTNDWNGESPIFFVSFVDQVTFEGIHLQEQIIKGSTRVPGRVVLYLDDYKAEFFDIEVSTAVQVRVHGIEAWLTIGAQSGRTTRHEGEEIRASQSLSILRFDDVIEMHHCVPEHFFKRLRTVLGVTKRRPVVKYLGVVK